MVSALTILNVALKVTLRNASLWLWDDVEFAYRVQHGSLYAHSPGYPGYMLLGRFSYLLYHHFTGQVPSEQPMILLSAILGGLIVLPAYFLIRTLLGKKQAAIGSLFIIINPFISQMSAYGMSDIPSVFFVTFSVALFYFGLKKDNLKILLLSAIAYGFSVQIRLTNFLLFPLFLVATLNRKQSLRNPRKCLVLFALVAVFSAFIGYAPLLCKLGPRGFFKFMTQYHQENAVNYTVEVMKERILFATKDLTDWITPLAGIMCLVGFHLLFLRRRPLFYDFSVWILSYVSFSLLYGPIPQFNRFCLPIYPALSLLFAHALERPITKVDRMLRGKWKLKKLSGLASFGLMLLVFVSMTVWSLPTYDGLQYWSHSQSPAKKFSLWINETVPYDSVIVAGEYCWVVKYYTNLPNSIWGSDPSWVSYSVNKELRNGRHVFIVSTHLKKCEFLTEKFDLEIYAQFDNRLKLYQILPES